MVKEIQRIDPEFQPVYTPPELKYKNCLLDALNENIQSVHTDKDFPVNWNVKLNKNSLFQLSIAGKRFGDLEWETQFYEGRMFNEQLQVERIGTVKIKSIEKFNDEDPNVLVYVSCTTVVWMFFNDLIDSIFQRTKIEDLRKQWHSAKTYVAETGAS